MSELAIPQKPFKVYETDAEGTKGDWVGEAPDAPMGVQVMCSFWLARQQVDARAGYLVALWDESLGEPGEIVAFIGNLGRG